MANVVIPNNAHINTKDEHIVHNIEGQTKDVMNKKNTLEFKSDLSPMYFKTDNAVYTTSGHTIKKNGNEFVDEEGRIYDIDSSYTSKAVDLSNLWSGECTSAVYLNEKVYSAWKTEHTAFIIISDLENNVLENYPIDIDDSNKKDILYYNIKIAPFIDVTLDKPNYVIERVYDDDTSKLTVSNGDTIIEKEFGYLLGQDLYSLQTENDIYIGVDDTDVRKRFTYSTENGIQLLFSGFGCIGSNGLITGEPIPYYYNGELVPATGDYKYLDNGIGVLYNAESERTGQDWITSNAALKTDSSYNLSSSTEDAIMTWGTKNHKKKAVVYVAGYDLVQDKYLAVAYNKSISPENEIETFTEESDEFAVLDSTSFYQVDFSDGFGNVEWKSLLEPTIDNGCNPFPYTYSVFNRAESRGIYWDYGPGWAKSYIRICKFDNYFNKRAFDQRWPTAIISFGLSSDRGYNVKRTEYLSPIKYDPTEYTSYTIVPDDSHPQGFSRAWYPIGDDYARFHTFNPTTVEKGMIWVDFIGADNLPNHSILSAIPFNVDLDPAENVKEQYYALNYVSTSMQGCLLTSGSVNNKGTTVYAKYNDIYSLFSNNLLVIVERNGLVKLEKVADYIYKTNTLKGNNLFFDSPQKFYGTRGFIPFNDEEIITINEMNTFSNPEDDGVEIAEGKVSATADGNSVYYSASGYNVQMTDYEDRATSYLLPAFIFQLVINSEETENFTFQLISNKKEITKPLLYNQFTYKDKAVDHFYNHSLNSTSIEYQTGKKMQSTNNNAEEELYGIKTFDIDKDGTVWWVTSSIQIFPLGIANEIGGINYLSSTVNLTDDYTVRLYRTNNITFLGYNPNTEVYKGATIFTIYGYNYSFDGQSIFYLGSGDDTSQVSFACYALGMQFLANSGTEAYFYSPFEKRIYLFTGSVTLQAADSLSREGKIVDSLYSSLEQILYLMTDDGNIIAKSQDDMCLIEKVDPTVYHFEGTDTGMILQGDWSYKKYRLWQTDETEWLPIEYETEWLGKNDSLFKVSSIDITFFKGDASTIKGQLLYGCINDNQPADEKIDFKVTAADWRASTFKVRLVPKNNVVKAFHFGIKSDDYIHIANVCVNINEISENTNAPAKNGHR